VASGQRYDVAILIPAVGLAAASAVAKMGDGRLDFFFCGVPTRSFALDGDTTFELRKIDGVEVLCIHRGPQRYVPNGALDNAALVHLLRTDGVAERQAD